MTIEELKVEAQKPPPTGGPSLQLLHYRALMHAISKEIVAEAERFHPGIEAVVCGLIRKVEELEVFEGHA